MKRIFLLFIFPCLFVLSCTNPVDNISVVIDGNVIHYKSTLIIADPTGTALPVLSVKITGQDSAHVYDYSGLKVIKATNGVVTLGIHPDFEPTSAKDVKFNVVLTANGYDIRVIPVSISFNQYSQVVNVAILKTTASSASASVKSKSTALTNGKILVADTSVTPVTATVTERTSVMLSAGTTFKGLNGVAINNTPLLESIVHYSAKSTSLLSLFPGASFSSSNVSGPDGKVGDAFLIPAAFANVDMTVGGIDVATLSQTFKISQEVNPDFVPLSTGQKVKAGDQLNVYSYNYSSGRWKYETIATVAADQYGKLAVTYTTLSPNGFFAGDVMTTLACKPASFKFIAPWMGTGMQPLNLDILSANGLTRLATKVIQTADGSVQSIDDLPATPMQYRVSTIGTAEILAQGNIANPCLGDLININLTSPAGTVDKITLKLTVNCPGKGVITPPDFDLFYKLSSSTGAFQLLGTVSNGVLNTTLLKIGSIYDFRVNWGAETTTVKSRTITANDGTTGSGGQSLSIQACGVN